MLHFVKDKDAQAFLNLSRNARIFTVFPLSYQTALTMKHKRAGFSSAETLSVIKCIYNTGEE